jgi:peptidoglycan hydrolase-like protein with peptidoglycan-binding domain
VSASHVKLVTFAGAGQIGRTSSQSGLTIQTNGSMLLVDGARQSSGMAPATWRQGAEWQDENNWWQAVFTVPCDAGYVSLPGVASGTECYSYEVQPPSTTLPPPTLVEPAAASHVDATLPIELSWESPHKLTPAGVDDQYQVKVITGGVTRWVKGDGSLSTTEWPMSMSGTDVLSITLPESTLTANAAYAWSVGTQWGPSWVWSPERALYPDAPPTMSTPTVSSPAGDLSPTVSWTASPGTGVITSHRVWIMPAAATEPGAGALWDSGVVQTATGPDTAPPDSPWTNGQSLKAWVRVYQTGGVAKTASSAAFAVSWTPPATPTLAVTAGSPVQVVVSGVTVGNVVQIEQALDWVTWTPLTSRTATATTMTVTSVLAGYPWDVLLDSVWGEGDTGPAVERIQAIVGADADGDWGPQTTTAVKAWQTLHGLEPDGLWAPLCEAALTEDDGQPVKLRARQGSIVEGVPMTSAWSTVQTVTATPDGCWLVDDTDRATALKISPVTDTRRGIVQGITATYGLGATRARVDSTPQAGERGELVLATDTLAERAALLAWLKDRSVWWIVMCPDDGQPHRPIRAARVSPPEWERLAQTALSSIYHLPVSWVEQA